jgi:hypothetical protein
MGGKATEKTARKREGGPVDQGRIRNEKNAAKAMDAHGGGPAIRSFSEGCRRGDWPGAAASLPPQGRAQRLR